MKNNKNKTRLLLLMLFTGLLGIAQIKEPVDYVNTFIGTGEWGNLYPGSQAPFGMISISPNNVFENYETTRSGYRYSQNEIYGFGMTHFSGVGCPSMQDLPFLPVVGDLNSSPVYNKSAYKSKFSHDKEFAKPGYYAVKLDSYNTNVKFTTTQRAAIGEIDFPANEVANMIFAPTNNANGISAGELKIDSDKNRISGYMSTGGFCWRDPNDRPYKVFFVTEFDSNFKDYGVWRAENKIKGEKSISGSAIAAYLTFDLQGKTKVKMRTAISFVSVENAVENLNAEIPDWNFENTYQKVTKNWAKYLNKIKVEGKNEDEKTTFYTAIYHNLLQANVFEDVNGSYIGFDDKIHTIEKGKNKYVNFSLWDTYRTTAYLQAIIAPKESSDMVNSLLLDAQQGGSFPNWSMNNQEYGVMNGYSPFPFIANMYAMGAKDFDLITVKDMMKKVSMEFHSSRKSHGWYGIEEYKKLGYVPVDVHGYGASMTLEYGVDDYAIAKICKAAGDFEAEKYYLNRSQNSFTLLNKKNNFLQGRNSDGAFITPFADNSEHGFNEGNAMQYFWSIPHSINKLIDKAGGADFVENRLDQFISKIETGWAPEKPFYWVGNEPCFGAVYVYNYLQMPWKAQYNVRRVTDVFKNSPNGMPGDDDVGAMSALYAFSALGLYPYLPGESGFTVTGPLFEKVTITLENGKQIVINGKGAEFDAPYIQEMKLNGKDYSNLWLDWSTLSDGANLSFKMGKEPNKKWGSSKKDMPPSYYPEKK
nr:GH92 family glycosyl hydrolase [uncultured Flavobacterium sp.]